MSQPDKRPNLNNLRQARGFLREVYGRYLVGKDRYPSARIVTPYEQLPDKIQPLAKFITHAWEVIDADEKYFMDMLGRGVKQIRKSGKEDAGGVVVAKSGINAVHFGAITLKDGVPHTTIGTFTPEEAIDLVNNRVNYAPGFTPARYNESGEVELPPSPDAVIVRPRQEGTSASFVYGNFGEFEGMLPVVGFVR